MKELFTFLLILLIPVCVNAQAPQAINYQGLARDYAGNTLASQSISLRLSIMAGSPTGTPIYVETHNTTTDTNGLFSLRIGEGSPTIGILGSINWGNNSYYLKIEIDPFGGTSYTHIGTSQFTSVPYSLYSANGLQAGSIVGDMLYWDGTTWVNSNILSRIENIESALVTAGLYIVSDYDGNEYQCIKIGDKLWMKENLRTTHFMNGEEIGTTNFPNQPIGGVGYPTFQWAYNGDENLAIQYGRLYTFYVTSNTAGICPQGFRIPTVEDWQEIENIYGVDAGGALKETGFIYWDAPNTGASNLSGFFGRGSGTRYNDNFVGLNQYAYYWTSTQVYTYNYNVGIAILGFDYSHIWYNGYNMSEHSAHAIRCVKDL